MKRTIKIKDLLEFNTEAEIKIIQPNCMSWEGDLYYGWNCGEGESESGTRGKSDAKEVCIFMGNLPENIS